MSVMALAVSQVAAVATTPPVKDAILFTMGDNAGQRNLYLVVPEDHN